ncbi:hypothetical protein [Bradyrhizobium sp. AUGA SZCCT0160]|uniref:hypothetical protein n=1 Tax=Bradyrhizobium sp. AUGA SZCCT0160 TaxID=2807662 RepID=UPI001BA6A305|nr:hypothetical protein [Bradyrhizobium sp. AUGA SZCCT0160]MBR1191464.1 hypothetical protein [Bradyrhizobium sp. AUGA SZCCT0160]
MDGYDQQLLLLIKTGKRDANQIKEAVERAFDNDPRLYALAEELLPAHLRQYNGAVVVTAEEILNKSIARYLVDKVRRAADEAEHEASDGSKPRSPIAAAIHELAGGKLSFIDLVRVVMTERAISKVFNGEYARYRKPKFQLIDAEGNLESFDDAYDRVMHERDEPSPPDVLSRILAVEKAAYKRGAIVTLKPNSRVALALRHDLLGASAALQLHVPSATPRAKAETFKKYLVETLKIDKVLAARIAARYRTHEPAIRARSRCSDQVRESPFVIANGDIGLLLDRTGGAVTQMVAKALRDLAKLYSEAAE